MKRILACAAVIVALVPLGASAQQTILSWGTMYGVDGGFVKHSDIRGVRGDELPWTLTSASGSLTTDGHLMISVRGLVFTNDPEVPPELRGINDETEFRGLVSCLTDEGHGRVSTVNIITSGFPATRSGDSDINTTINLPDACVAPIIFVIAGEEEHWFAVTGAEKPEATAAAPTRRRH
jgi:hypothetical protein